MGVGALFAGIGAAVWGATGAAAVIAGVATVAVVGAAVGGLVAAVSGGNVLEGMLYGAVGGVVLVGAAGMAGLGATGTSTATTSGIQAGVAAEGVGWHGALASNAAAAEGAFGASATGAAGASGTLGGALSESWMTGLATVGASTVNGVMNAKAQKEATEAAKLEGDKSRLASEKEAALGREHAERLAGAANETSMAIAEMGNDYHLADKLAEAREKYKLADRNSANDSRRQMEQYKDKVTTDEGVLERVRERRRSSVLDMNQAVEAENYSDEYVSNGEEQQRYTEEEDAQRQGVLNA